MWSARLVSSVVSSATTSDASARADGNQAAARNHKDSRKDRKGERPARDWIMNHTPPFNIRQAGPIRQEGPGSMSFGHEPGPALGSREVDLDGSPVASVTVRTQAG